MNRLTKIQYNCKQATFLIEKKEMVHLSFRETIELRIHLAGCAMCRLYQKQSALIGQMVNQIFTDHDKAKIRLDEQFKDELQHRIEEELNKN